MRKGLKLALGAATVWPLFYIVAFTVAIVSMAFMAPEMFAAGPWPFMVIVPLHLITILSIFGMLAYYIVHLIRNNGMDSTARIIWAIVLVKFSVFAMPVYWYLHVWRTRTRARTRRRGEAVMEHAADVMVETRDARIRDELAAFERELEVAPVASHR